MLNDIDLSRADLNLLVLFDVVFAERHVGRAAQVLNLSPSAVSHGLGRLRRLLNDPLFLKTPKGVVPTERAVQLAEPVADILAQTRRVIASAEPFNPATSRRRFRIGAPDGVSATFLMPFLSRLSGQAHGIDIGLRQIAPPRGARLTKDLWALALADLESRAMDIAALPLEEVPARFEEQLLYVEDFVIAMRAGHPAAGRLTMDEICKTGHLVVSPEGDSTGFLDDFLAKEGRSRRIVMTAPNSLFALAVLAKTDFVAALPRRFVAMHRAPFGIVAEESPLPLLFASSVRAIASKAAMMDAGVSWLFNLLGEAVRSTDRPSFA